MDSLGLVTEYIIKHARNQGISDVSPLKLQKLLYLTYEEYVKEYKRPLFNVEFEVWRHGPVIRRIYDKYKAYGSEVIPIATEVDEAQLDEKIKAVVAKVIENFGMKSAWDLVDATHRKEGPWYKKMINNEPSIRFEDVVASV